MRTIRVGTRGSRLAIAQAASVVAMLEGVSGASAELVTIQSGGDLDPVTPLHKMAGQGVFASELQHAVLEGRVDVAVHSLKDMPLRAPAEAPVTAIPPRASPADLLLTRDANDFGAGLPPPGMRVGTSSPRRQSQLLSQDRDIVPLDVRGNVETRLRKLREGWMDGLVLAEAAYERLPETLFTGLGVHRLPLDAYPTAPGQGALAIQTRRGGEAAEWVAQVDHPPTRRAVRVERALLAALGGGCGMPLGMTVHYNGAGWTVDASLAGSEWRTEDPPHLARCRVDTEDLGDVVPAILKALEGPRSPPIAGTRVTARGQVLLVADTGTVGTYRPRLLAGGWTVSSWYPFVYEPTFHDTLPPDLLQAWERCTWVLLTSQRALDALGRLTEEAPRKGPLVGAVGPRTAAAARACGLPVHFVSRGATAAALAEELVPLTGGGDRFLHLAGVEARTELPLTLQEAGLTVTQFAVYRRRGQGGAPLPGSGPFDAVVAFSPRGATEAAERLSGISVRSWVAIGPTTARTLLDRGLKPVSTARRRTPSGVLEALEGTP